MPPRIQIRPPRREPPINLNDTWANVLEPAINQIYLLHKSETAASINLSFKVLYDSSYRLVTQGHGKTLCRKISEVTRSFVMTLPKQLPKSGDLLAPLSKIWQNYHKSLEMVSDVFMYLDRSYCDENGLPRSDRIGKQLFKNEVLVSILDPLLDQLIEKLDQQRYCQTADTESLTVIVDMLKCLTDDEAENDTPLFDTKFRSRLMVFTIKKYKLNLENISDKLSYSQLREIESWLINESSHKSTYLPEEITAEILDQLRTEIIGPALPSILSKDSGVIHWIQTKNIDAFKLAAQLEQQGMTKSLIDQLANCLTQSQLALNENQLDATNWVEQTILLRTEYVAIAETVYQNAWEDTLDRTHKAAIAERESVEDVLALYLDQVLKKNTSIFSESIDTALDNAITIYAALRDRDEFGRKFQRLLARRLLNNSSRSLEYEMSWFKRLKEADASSDARIFEEMLKDINDSKLLFTGTDSISVGTIPTNVHVLKMNLWPKSMQPNPQTSYPVKLPPVIAEAQNKFVDFYHQVKVDRKLNWNYALGNADVKIRVGGKTYFVSVPLLCMSILSLFEGDSVYTTQEVSQYTQIPLGGEVERHLKSLYLGTSTNLLIKIPQGNDVQPTDKFIFNENFSSNKLRFKIKVIHAREQSVMDLPPEDRESLAQDRVERASAAIVRIMKSHKVMKHTLLMQNVVSQLQPHFLASPQLIKSAIQDLLDKEYIKRADKDQSTYTYVA